jgi:hypothetical protein
MMVTLRSVLIGAAVVSAGALAVPMFACSLIVPASDVQCSTDDDCHARGPSFAGATCVAQICRVAASDTGPWGCLDETPVPSDPTQQVDVQIVLYDAFQPFTFGGGTDGGTDLDLANYVPQTGVTAVACNPLDPDCQSPVGAPVVTDDAGVASLTVPGGFTGFYRLERDGDVPSYLYPGARLLAGQPKVSIPATMTSEANYAALSAAFATPASADQDAGPQAISITQFDCLDKHATGVAFTSSPPAATALYLGSGSVPSLGAMQTLATGVGVLTNVPPGGTTITATLAGGEGGAGRVVSTASVVTHPGTITLVYMRPRTR